MNYLLDTHIFLWISVEPERLNKRALVIVSALSSNLFLSSASSWEIAIKYAIGALPLPSPPSQFVPDAMHKMAIRSLDITHFHALAAGALPQRHRDPFDRMLVAQTRSEGMTLLTADDVFKTYDVEMILCR